jgi:spermidine synthase
VHNQFVDLKCEIDAVEIDEKIARAAKDWFDLKEDEQTRVHIANGLTFIKEASKEGKTWDVVIVDINCSDNSSDLWGPTGEFLENEILNECKSILVNPSGLQTNSLIRCR